MKLARTIVRIACLAAMLSCISSAAQAQTFGQYGAHGFAHPGFFGYFNSPYAAGRIPTPPYFAIHPPVYYSHPVPRTYGYSPYAYPGSVRTPEVSIEEAEVIINPHAEQPETEPTSNMKVVRYHVIENPYVRAELRSNPAQRFLSTAK